MTIEVVDGTIIITTNEAQFESDDVESALFHLGMMLYGESTSKQFESIKRE